MSGPGSRTLALAFALLLHGWAAAQVTRWRPTGKRLPPSELAALLDFQAHIEQDMGLLSTWSNASHPCTWEGVICECADVYPPQDCSAAADLEYEHVFGLDFGIRKPSNKTLTGTLSVMLGDLLEARVLYFHANRLRCGRVARPGSCSRRVWHYHWRAAADRWRNTWHAC